MHECSERKGGETLLRSECCPIFESALYAAPKSSNNKEDKVKRLLILAATLVATLSIGVATAGAAPVTPNGYCGAANMLMAWPDGGANVPDGGGMQHAMTVNNPNGNNGMFGAVAATAC